MNKKNLSIFLSGIIGSLLLFFIGWEYNIPLAAWAAFPLLIYSFRSIKKWYAALPLVLLMIAVRFISIIGGWDMELWLMLVFSAVVVVPLIAALYLDRFYVKRMSPLLATLVFPCTYIVLDYLVTFTNLGMTFSLAYSQSTFLELAQIASVFGSWFIGFIVAWFAPTAVLLVKNIKNLCSVWKPLTIYAVCLSLVMAFGCFRLALSRPQSRTVRIASVTVPHDQDYWTITDNSTPKSDAEKTKPKMKSIEDNLFSLSQKAADYGAKVIFWSEGNCPMYEDDYDAFLERAKSFAKQNHVYFMPSSVVLLYGRTKNNNLAIMINPEGNIEYRYEKTISWYPTDSDGKLPVINTPYGKLSTAICFDMDYPDLISQAKDADIMLVPGFDTEKIADFHTRVSFLRGIENGFSVVRQANKGASISADYMGNTITYQNYFHTDDRVMISDVPAKGVWTLYGFTGEIFLWIVFAGFIALNIWGFRNKRKKSKKQPQNI